MMCAEMQPFIHVYDHDGHAYIVFYTRVKLKPSCSIYNEHTHTQREDLQNETCTNLYYD